MIGEALQNPNGPSVLWNHQCWARFSHSYQCPHPQHILFLCDSFDNRLNKVIQKKYKIPIISRIKTPIRGLQWSETHKTPFWNRCQCAVDSRAAAEAGRAPVLDDGGPRDPARDCGELLPRTGSRGLSWPPEGLHSKGRGHHIYTVHQNKESRPEQTCGDTFN